MSSVPTCPPTYYLRSTTLALHWSGPLPVTLLGPCVTIPRLPLLVGRPHCQSPVHLVHCPPAWVLSSCSPAPTLSLTCNSACFRALLLNCSHCLLVFNMSTANSSPLRNFKQMEILTQMIWEERHCKQLMDESSVCCCIIPLYHHHRLAAVSNFSLLLYQFQKIFFFLSSSVTPNRLADIFWSPKNIFLSLSSSHLTWNFVSFGMITLSSFAKCCTAAAASWWWQSGY